MRGLYFSGALLKALRDINDNLIRLNENIEHHLIPPIPEQYEEEVDVHEPEPSDKDIIGDFPIGH